MRNNQKNCVILPIPSNIFCFIDSSTFFQNWFICGVYEPTYELKCMNLLTKQAVLLKLPVFLQIFVSKFFISLTKSSVFFTFCSQAQEKVLFNSFFKGVSLVSFGFYRIIQFVGFRYRQRWFRSSQVLRYRLGYNSKVWFRCPSDFVSIIRKISPKKRTHIFFSFNNNQLCALVNSIKSYRPATIYKGRGVNFKEQPMVLKDGKKAIW